MQSWQAGHPPVTPHPPGLVAGGGGEARGGGGGAETAAGGGGGVVLEQPGMGSQPPVAGLHLVH